MTIKIVRLLTGEDVVGEVTADENLRNVYHIENPMTVEINFRGQESIMMLQHWLPLQIIKENKAELNTKDIVSMVEPNEVFEEYYVNTVSNLKKIMEAKNALDKVEKSGTDEDMEYLIEKFNSLELNNNIKH